ncbi:hypothetical protein N7468_002034 [Penicillium chermesinum]|uniref:DUF7707 domain-containing protein n=1 Tax=Penicillium chermesinum TaxID=63820 RepID=A0A9W9PHQ3_9EURO|nr:uncharacterized protein N7468_002034 [Penicillium chermesinum]KAJ5247051.1 hypothetical protein N7468_002034 [Penicillium chermesinum]KAJ6145298.1 hypothetical protein N7470_009193 [Penicillium chermesinum]
MISYAVVLSALAASALGANSTVTTPTLPAGFNIGLVKPDELNSWCLGQRNVCPDICNGGTKQNSCDPSTLQYSCVCSDGSVPDVSQYQQTVPFYVCEANYGQCIDAHPNDAQGQEACKEAKHCGTKNATATDTSSSSASASPTTMLSSPTDTTDTIETESTPASSSVAASSQTSNAAVPFGSMMETYSTGLVAGAMYLAMRLVL